MAINNLTLSQADIIILAKVHNPSILSPEWLRDNCDIDKVDEQFVHTPDFSLYRTGNIQITLDQARLQLINKTPNDETISAMVAICEKYINALEHIPYVAIGLNAIWNLAKGDSSSPSLSLVVDGRAIPTTIDEYNIDFGGIVYATHNDHRVRLLIEKPLIDKIDLTFNFNFNYDVAQKKVNDLVNIVHQFESKLSVSKDLVTNILLG